MHVPKSPTPYHTRPDDRAPNLKIELTNHNLRNNPGLFLSKLRSPARVVKMRSNEDETTSFQGFSPTRVGERTWKRGREWDWGVWAPGASRKNVTLLNWFWEKNWLFLQSRFNCSFSFIITLVSEESWTGCCLSSSQTCPMLLVRACFRALKIELRSETSKTLNFRNYSLNPTFCPKWEVSRKRIITQNILAFQRSACWGKLVRRYGIVMLWWLQL